MKYLIDTHIAIWAISDDSKLSKMAKEILMKTLKYPDNALGTMIHLTG